MAGSGKASLYADVATAVVLVAMVNPAELLGEDLCWQGPGGGAHPGPSGHTMPGGRGPLTPTTISNLDIDLARHMEVLFRG